MSQRSVVLDRCEHSVYCVPDDWRSQARAGIPPSKRISWYCWWCRPYEMYKFSVATLLELARTNCDANVQPVRETDSDTVLIKNADYDLHELDGDDALDENVAA